MLSKAATHDFHEPSLRAWPRVDQERLKTLLEAGGCQSEAMAELVLERLQAHMQALRVGIDDCTLQGRRRHSAYPYRAVLQHFIHNTPGDANGHTKHKLHAPRTHHTRFILMLATCNMYRAHIHVFAQLGYSDRDGIINTI